MSIPADPERDADLIVAAAIDELEALRAERDALKAQVLAVHDALHRECDGTVDLPREIRALRAQVEAWEEKAKVWLMSPEAAKHLDGYRKLGKKCARFEAQVEAARRVCLNTMALGDDVRPQDILDAMDEAAKK